MIRYRRLYESINPSGLNFRKDRQCKYLMKWGSHFKEDYEKDPLYDIQVADAELGDHYFTFVAAYNLNYNVPNEGAFLTVFFRHKKDNFWYCYEKALNKINEFGRVAMDTWKKLVQIEDRDFNDSHIGWVLKNLGYSAADDRHNYDVEGKTYADVNDYWSY